MTDQSMMARRRMMMRRRRFAAGVLVALLAVCAYVAACAFTPLPAPTVALNDGVEREVSADATSAEAVVNAQTLPTAIGYADGETVWANDDTPYALGSVSKLITVLVCLEASPLEPGADGETYVWTEDDRANQDYYLGLQGVAYPIPVGTEITQRQMLQFIFLPSSNDYAYAYAMMTFGDSETFLAAVEEFTQAHGLDSVSFVEPTGMDDGNRASAADLVRIARIALQNPTVREFNGMESAEMPWGIGTIENTNPLLGNYPGIIGVKTGMLSTVGYNFIAAQEADAFGRPIIKISVTLARPSKDARAESGAEMLDAMEPLPQQTHLVEPGEPVGEITTFSGERVPLVTDGEAATVLLPGESSQITVELDKPDEIDVSTTGSEAGRLLITTPTGESSVPVVIDGEIETPGLWWRLTHPGLVFGWAR